MSGIKIYNPRHVMAELGITRGTHYELIKAGVLPYTRLRPGGDRVHLPEHLDQYREYLVRQTKGGEKSKPVR